MRIAQLLLPFSSSILAAGLVHGAVLGSRQTDAGTITFCSLPNFGGSCTSFAAPINQCPALDSSIGDFVQSVDLAGGDGGLVCFICGTNMCADINNPNACESFRAPMETLPSSLTENVHSYLCIDF